MSEHENTNPETEKEQQLYTALLILTLNFARTLRNDALARNMHYREVTYETTVKRNGK